MGFWRKKEAEDYVARKDYNKAMELLREKIGQQSSNAALRVKLAEILLLDGQKDEAVDEYCDAARLFKQQGSLMKAVAIYKRILRIEPNLKEIENLLHELSPKVQSNSGIQRSNGCGQVMSAAESRLFRNLSPDEFQNVVDRLSLRQFAPGEIVVTEGDAGNSMFVVIRGEVRVLTRDMHEHQVILAKLGEGEFFGEIALLTGKPRTATIVANTDSELLELKRDDYQAIVKDHPNVKKVMEDFHVERAYNTVEAMIQSFKEGKHKS